MNPAALGGLSPLGTDFKLPPSALGTLGASSGADFATILRNVQGGGDVVKNDPITEATRAALAAPGLDVEHMSDEGIETLKELRAATQKFEGIFMKMLFKAMRASVPQSEMFHGGQGEETFTEMLDHTLVEQATESDRGLGIGKQLYENFARQVYTRHPMAFSQSASEVDMRV